MHGARAARLLGGLALPALLALAPMLALASCGSDAPVLPTATPVYVVASGELASVATALAGAAGEPVSLSLASYQGCLERVSSGFAEAGFLWGPEPAPSEAYITDLVAADALAVVVHPSNQVGPLSVEELREIFAGHVGDWWAYGQSMGQVLPVARGEGAGTRLAFAELVMDGARPSTGTVVAASDGGVLDYVAAHPAAIGYVAASNLREGVRALRIGEERPEPQKVREGKYALMVGVWLVSRATPGGDAVWSLVQSEAGQDALQRYLAGPEALQ